MASSDTYIPLILTRNLPRYAGTITSNFTFVAVQGNETTVRIPWDSITDNFITISGTIPGDPTSPGVEGQIAWDDTGVYTYYEGTWGKSPRVTVNWDDYTEDMRALLVNKVMDLTPAELANVMTTLGISKATTEKEGLVKLAGSMTENLGNVPTTAQVVDYVTEQLRNISITGGGGDKISAYQGGVDIKGPNGELILTYDAVERVLYIGHGVDIVRSKTDIGVEYYGPDNALMGAVNTHVDDVTEDTP